MLVRVTNQHDEEIKTFSGNMHSIMEIIKPMEEYILGLLIIQTGEQLD